MAEPAGKRFRIESGQTLVCLGDSITQNPVGYCAMLAALIGASYPERNIRVINAGVSGNKIPDMLARLESDVLAHRPDWVTVNVGINDVWHGLGGKGGVALPDYRAGLEKLVDRLLAAKARVVVLPPTVIEENPKSTGNTLLTGYREAMRAVAAARPGVLVAPTDIDFDAALRTRPNLTQPRAPREEPGKTLTTDGVHMRGSGDAVMAVAVLKALDFFAS